MASGAVAGEKSGGCQDKRARAKRGHVAGTVPMPAQEGESFSVFHNQDLARAAGHEENIRSPAIRESFCRHKPQAIHIADRILGRGESLIPQTSPALRKAL
jgi:hypothetical protein